MAHLTNSDRLIHVMKWLKAHNLEYEIRNPYVGHGYENTGVWVKISPPWTVSIQTSEQIAGRSFAETALWNNGSEEFVYEGDFDADHEKHGYPRWKKAKDLFAHIERVVLAYKDDTRMLPNEHAKRAEESACIFGYPCIVTASGPDNICIGVKQHMHWS